MTRIWRAGVLLAIAVALGGCAVPDQRDPVAIKTSAPPAPTSTTLPGGPTRTISAIFLVRGDRLVAVERRSPPDLAAVMARLLSGPTSDELTHGLSSAIPTGTALQSTSMTGTTAELAFNNTLGSISGEEQVLAFAQIVVTATALPGVDQVRISIGGQVVNPPLADGTLAQRAVSRDDYAAFLGP